MERAKGQGYSYSRTCPNVTSSMGAEVDSTVAARLTRIDAYDWAASWQQSLTDDGSIGKAAKAAERANKTSEDLVFADGD